MLSQNVLFVGESNGDDPLGPPGMGIARHIADELRRRGFNPDPTENWRDCGWSINLAIGDAALQVALTQMTESNLWMLQVACVNQPGVLARLFGAKRSDRSLELFDIASAIHRILMEAGCRKIRWRIDGYPDDGNSSPEPRRSVPGKA